MSIWFLASDLMFSSRLEHAAQQAGKTLLVESSPTELSNRLANSADCPRLLIIDLERWGPDVPSLISAAKALPSPPKIVAYGPHVHEAKLNAAQSAGCDLVLTRGQFDKQFAAIIRT